jgi:hypothetical protein
MILGAAQGKRNAEIARELGVSTDTVRKWRMHWIGLQAVALSDLSVRDRLADLPRPGRPWQITAEQTCQVLALACEHPKERPISRLSGAGNCRGNDGPRHHRTHFTPARSSSLKKGALQPHLIRYGLTPPQDAQRETTIRAICTVYHQAPALAKQGERTVSTDELTGVQALERKHPGLPLAPGHVQRRECEYERDGTRCFMLSRDIVSGKLLAPLCGPTRSEEDFLAHVQAVVATDPKATRWHFVCDNLTIHQSESLVRWVAQISDIEKDLG